jgi:hypothetical protein
MDMERFRKVVNFHLMNYTDPKKDRKPANVIMAAQVLGDHFKDYDSYARECIKKDIAGVTKKLWEEDQ